MSERPLLDFPERVTKSASDFYEQHLENMMLLGLGGLSIQSHEKFMTSVAEALSTDGKTPKEMFPGPYAKLESFKKHLKDNTPALTEVGLARTVDNFLSYVADVLTQAIIARPDLLRTQEQVALEEVLNHESIEDFVQWAAERRVSQLSFKGLDEIAGYIEKRLGMKLHSVDQDWMELNRAIAVRNIIVHRRSIADDRFIWAMKGAAGVERGEKYEAPRGMLPAVMRCTMSLVRDFDARVSEKFDIELLNSAEQEWRAKVDRKDF